MKKNIKVLITKDNLIMILILSDLMFLSSSETSQHERDKRYMEKVLENARHHL